MAKAIRPTKKLAEKWRRPSVSDDVTVCKICDRDLIDPRILPCLHSFCEECLFLLLRSYETHKKFDRSFLCPVCKVHIPCHFLGKVSSKWLNMFPKKITIDKMKEAILVVEEKCSPCSMSWKVIPGTRFCSECQEYMCVDCEADHKSNPMNKTHKLVDYEVKEMKNTPASNISKFQCKLHSSLRYTSFCEIHREFLCNTCKDGTAHRHCRITSKVIEATSNITKAETKLTVLNSLKRDERNKGKQLLKLIEQIDAIQTRLQQFREKQEMKYCNYVMQATLTEQKTEAIDALKGKLEFVKTHQTHDTIYSTMNKVEELITGYTNVYVDEDSKHVKVDMHKGIAEVEKILKKSIFDGTDRGRHTEKDIHQAEEDNTTKTSETGNPVSHICKKHVDDSLDEESFIRLGVLMESVGAICYTDMFATAFRVGSKYVMTAAHTVRDIVDPDRTGESEWSALEHKKTYLSFEYLHNPHGPRYRLSQHVPYLNDKLNIAILEIVNTEEKLPSPLVLSTVDTSQLGNISHVSIIGYGHAGSHKKHLDSRCPIIKVDSDRAKQAEAWLKLKERKHRCNLLVGGKEHSSVKWNYDEMKDPLRIAVDTCMEYRALGAPVIYTGQPDPEVMAVFTHSVPDCFTEMPKQSREHYREYRFEVATKMSSLYEQLIVETRVLADDIFTKDKQFFDTDNTIYSELSENDNSNPQ